MGESMVEAQNMDNKMGESVASRETLGVSVSFGKYENDALSWEKWSTFSPNKYLEEVGKCSTPGSVAQKKAFFEAHYKKIAAMKAEAELLDQEKAMENNPSGSDDHTENSYAEVKEELRDDIESKASVSEEEEISAVEASGKIQEEKPDSSQSHCQEEATSVKDESFQDESGERQHEKPGNEQSHLPEETTSVKERFQDVSGKSQDEKPDSYQFHRPEETTSVRDESIRGVSMQVGNALESQHMLSSQSPEEITSVKDESFRDGSGKCQDEKKPNSNQFHCPEETTSTSVRDESVQDVPMQAGHALEARHLLASQSPTAFKSNANKLEEAVLVNDESMKLVKQHFQVDSQTEHPQASKKESPRPKAQNVARKVNPAKAENIPGMKKKPTPLIPKSSQTSTTRLSKPKTTPTPTSAARSSSKKTSSSLSSKTKNPSASESIRAGPASLHLSISMSSVNSDTTSSVTSSRRRSIFMEQMGDKDIVKRAFKTFQNRVNQLPSSEGRSSAPRQMATKGSEQKASTSMASQKENERLRKAAEKINPARGRSGPAWQSMSTGSLKGVGADGRRPKAVQSSMILRNNEKAERRKEFFRNLEEKSNAREAERTQLSSKPKEVKEVEMKKLRQNLSFKAKPMPSFYRAQGVSKSTSEKETAKNGTQRRPDSHR